MQSAPITPVFSLLLGLGVSCHLFTVPTLFFLVVSTKQQYIKAGKVNDRLGRLHVLRSGREHISFWK